MTEQTANDRYAELRGKFACRFCRHDQYTHNPVQGCEACSCLAHPSEAAPRTDAELDAPILPASQIFPSYEARTRRAATAAELALRDLLSMVDQFDTPRAPGRVTAFVGDVRQVALRGLGEQRG